MNQMQRPFDSIMLSRKEIKLLKNLHPHRFYSNDQVKNLLRYGLIKINPIFEEEGNGVAQYNRTSFGNDYLKYLKTKPSTVFKKCLIWFVALLATLLITAVFDDLWSNRSSSQEHTEPKEEEYQSTNLVSVSDNV